MQKSVHAGMVIQYCIRADIIEGLMYGRGAGIIGIVEGLILAREGFVRGEGLAKRNTVHIRQVRMERTCCDMQQESVREDYL